MVWACQRHLPCTQVLEKLFSDGCDDDLVVQAGCAIVGAQIEAGFLRFDTGQQQRPAASGTGWAKPIDEFINGDVWHELAPTGGSVQHSLSPIKAGYGAVISHSILVEAQSDSIRANLRGRGQSPLFRRLKFTPKPLNRIGFEGVGAGAFEAFELAWTLAAGREGKHHRRAALRTKPGPVELSHA
jgi:hypothetical protein